MPRQAKSIAQDCLINFERYQPSDLGIFSPVYDGKNGQSMINFRYF